MMQQPKGIAPDANYRDTSVMPDYRRAWHPGGTYFFTVNLLQRHGNDLLTRHVDLLRNTVRSARRRHPFTIHGWVVLPDHLHCVIELPQNDADFATRGPLPAPCAAHGWGEQSEGVAVSAGCAGAALSRHSCFPVHRRLTKMDFSKALPRTERISKVRARRGERGIWQRRYWEHLIRDEADFRAWRHLLLVHTGRLCSYQSDEA